MLELRIPFSLSGYLALNSYQSFCINRIKQVGSFQIFVAEICNYKFFIGLSFLLSLNNAVNLVEHFNYRIPVLYIKDNHRESHMVQQLQEY